VRFSRLALHPPGERGAFWRMPVTLTVYLEAPRRGYVHWSLRSVSYSLMWGAGHGD